MPFSRNGLIFMMASAFLVQAEKRVVQIQFGFLQEVDVFYDTGLMAVKDDMMVSRKYAARRRSHEE